jgi:beta-lactamase regulating signal transducer with metallopeptidase domain
MISELISLLLWANVTLGVGILIVFALRVPVRRFAGARVAYALWLVPLVAFLGWFVPARQVTVAVALPAVVDAADTAMTVAAPGLPALAVVVCWLIGVGAMAAMFVVRQRGFVRSAGAPEPVAALGRNVFRVAPSHGPAVVGALRPMIVLPRDFAERFSAEEQALVLAHERAHLERFDPMVNAAAMGLRAVNWFNPLVHLAARALRIDQELACDAAVLARHAGAHRAYGEAMLKSHAAAFDVPIGCAWHTAAFHPLKERILMLKSSPSRLGRSLGLSLVAAAALGVCGAVWLLRPVEVLAAPTDANDPVLAESDGDIDQAINDALTAVADAATAAADSAAAAADSKTAAADSAAALADTRAAMAEAREATRLAMAAAREALKEAEPALAEARREAAAAMREARKVAAVAAREGMQDARAAIAAARQAVRDARPAIAAAEQAVRNIEPAIAIARLDAARSARLARACRRALAQRPSLDNSADADLRALAKLACIHVPVERPADE